MTTSGSPTALVTTATIKSNSTPMSELRALMDQPPDSGEEELVDDTCAQRGWRCSAAIQPLDDELVCDLQVLGPPPVAWQHRCPEERHPSAVTVSDDAGSSVPSAVGTSHA